MPDKEMKKLASKFMDEIDKEYKIKFAYLFGSRARGEENKESDIDLGIYFEDNYSEMEDMFVRGDIIERGKVFFCIPVDIVSLNKASLLLKHEIVKEGIVLKDNDERASFESIVLREYFDFKYYADIYNESMIDSIKKGDYFRRD